VDELKSSGKPFEISKRAVWEAYKKVKANKGAPGVDGVSIEGSYSGPSGFIGSCLVGVLVGVST
jgi:hypothetical protein